MKNNTFFLILSISLIGLLFLESFAWGDTQEDKTLFTIHPYSFQRSSTSSKDKAEGVFLPQYNDIASNPERGITWEDWQKHDLSKERFISLDSNSDDFISKEELDQDLFMGQAPVHQQDMDLIARACKKEFPDYKERLRVLKNQYPRLKSDGLDNRFEDVQYAINKDVYTKDALPLSLFSETGSEEIATKTYIQLKQGNAIRKNVDLGSMAYLAMQDQKEEENLFLHIFGLVTLGLVAFITIVSCKLF